MQSIVLGSHAYFLRAGITVDSTVVSATAKPDNDPTTNWSAYSLGIIGDVTVDTQMTTIDIMSPSPGQRRKVDELQSGSRLIIDFELEQLSPLAIELLFNSALIDPAAQSNPGAFVPLAKTGPLKGWLKFQTYNHLDQAMTIVDMWCTLKKEGNFTISKSGDDTTRMTVRAEMLTSSLNSGQLSNLT